MRWADGRKGVGKWFIQEGVFEWNRWEARCKRENESVCGREGGREGGKEEEERNTGSADEARRRGPSPEASAQSQKTQTGNYGSGSGNDRCGTSTGEERGTLNRGRYADVHRGEFRHSCSLISDTA